MVRSENVSRIKKLESQVKANRAALGRFAAFHGATEAAKEFNVPVHQAAYWKSKYDNPDFKDGKHGGLRWQKFSVAQLTDIVNLVSHIVRERPTVRLSTYRAMLKTYHNLNVSVEFIRQLFVKNGMTYGS